jgi:hypothetical protein
VDTDRESTASFLGGGGPRFEKVRPIEDGLGRLGLEPSDIDTIILTHLHGDHVELAHKFPKASFIVQRAELDFARQPRRISSAIPYRKEFFGGLKFEVIDGDKEILPGIKVLLTPGHSPGGQSVAIRTSKGVAVITGFCCIRENFEPQQTIRDSSPIITHFHLSYPFNIKLLLNPLLYVTNLCQSFQKTGWRVRYSPKFFSSFSLRTQKVSPGNQGQIVYKNRTTIPFLPSGSRNGP